MKSIALTTALCLFAAVAFSQSKIKTPDTAKNTSTTGFKMHYDALFKRNADNTISPIQPLQINGEMVNTDTKIAAGATYGGIDLSAYTGHDMLVDTLHGVVIIRRVVK